MRVLSWNLFHGRARPAAGRPLLVEFALALRGWAWDVALLQECPPHWPPLLAHACAASYVRRLTSRNEPLAPRLAIARRNPDLIRANGGGCNAILVRGAIAEHCTRRLAWWPERRWMHGVQVEGGASHGASARGTQPRGAGAGEAGLGRAGTVWIVNVHATGAPERRAQGEIARAHEAALAWAGAAPVVLGGDFNTPAPAWRSGFAPAISLGVDHVAARGLRAVVPGTLPDAGALSDHRPLLVELVAAV